MIQDSQKNYNDYAKSKGVAYEIYLIAKNALNNKLTVEEKYNILLGRIKEKAKKGYLCYIPNDDKDLPVGIYSYYDKGINNMLDENGFKIKENYPSGKVLISWDFSIKRII